MVSLQPHFTSLIKSLPSYPVEQEKLNEIVSKALERTRSKTSAENRKSQWEFLLKNEIFKLAALEGTALKETESTYYDDLTNLLDLTLTFTEHDACEQTFPFIVLQDLLETQTIASCSHIFSWIEAQSARLTEGMVPQKGKALILLRTLNDLLRRLSKMGSTTIFCGRILTFLSGVFPLGERSGVNLRGEYGPTWEGVKFDDRNKVDEDVEMKAEDSKSPTEGEDKMQVDKDEKSRAQMDAEKREDFYNTFWSLQLSFSKPPLFSSSETLTEFKNAVNKVLPAIKEATAKERAMMGRSVGGGGTASLKRKREPDVEETNSNEYFFAKFLTSPDLLDLEIADTHFRRQFLFQLLILLNHLLTFTEAAKATWVTPRNRSLQMDFTLDPADAQWVQETVNKAIDELKQTTPNGRAFADTVSIVLEREKNWVKWKNELCAPFDKAPWSTEIDGVKVGLMEATNAIRMKMREPPEDWPWRLGTEPLTEIWDMGYRDLWDLKQPFQPGEIKDFVKKIKLEDMRIDMRKKALDKVAERLKAQAKAAEVAAAPKASIPVPETTEAASSTPTNETVDQPMAPPLSEVAPTQTTPPAATPASSLPHHPSLPPRPGSPIKPTTSQESTTASAAPTPAPISAAVQAPPAAAPAQTTAVPAPPKPTDPIILKHEENKQRWAWLALRTARDQYLQYFGKIGTGDIVALMKEIQEGEQAEREKAAAVQKEEISAIDSVIGGPDEPGPENGAEDENSAPTSAVEPKTEGEDVKME